VNPYTLDVAVRGDVARNIDRNPKRVSPNNVARATLIARSACTIELTAVSYGFGDGRGS